MILSYSPFVGTETGATGGKWSAWLGAGTAQLKAAVGAGRSLALATKTSLQKVNDTMSYYTLYNTILKKSY